MQLQNIEPSLLRYALQLPGAGVHKNANPQVIAADSADLAGALRRHIARTARIEIKAQSVCSRLQRDSGIVLVRNAADLDKKIHVFRRRA
jgi:hypothetical protein